MLISLILSACKNVFGLTALIFHPITLKNLFGESGIMPLILQIPINPILQEKIRPFFGVTFLGPSESEVPLGWGSGFFSKVSYGSHLHDAGISHN